VANKLVLVSQRLDSNSLDMLLLISVRQTDSPAEYTVSVCKCDCAVLWYLT